MVREYRPQNTDGMKILARDLRAMRVSDPEGYAKFIEETRQRSYKLAGRNRDGSRRK